VIWPWSHDRLMGSLVRDYRVNCISLLTLFILRCQTSKWNKAKRNKKRRVINVESDKTKQQLIIGGTNPSSAATCFFLSRQKELWGREAMRGAEINLHCKVNTRNLGTFVTNLWEANGRSARQESVHFLWNQNFNYHVHNNPPLNPPPSHASPAHTLTPYFFDISFNIILYTTLIIAQVISFLQVFLLIICIFNRPMHDTFSVNLILLDSVTLIMFGGD
jgi:hypothetical protein